MDWKNTYITEDTRRDWGEPRYKAFAIMDGRLTSPGASLRQSRAQEIDCLGRDTPGTRCDAERDNSPIVNQISALTPASQVFQPIVAWMVIEAGSQEQRMKFVV